MAPDPPNPQHPEPTPAEIFADHLASREAASPEEPPAVDLEALCRAHPDHAEELRRLTAHWEQVTQVVAALGAGRTLQERLTRRFGPGVDPGLSLDEPPSTARPASSPSATMRRLVAAPQSSRYESRGEIARGGMGAILRVWDADLRRTLAMKVALVKGGGERPSRDDERLLTRFLEEAQVTAQLDHPGILPVHELGLDADGRVFFTMPLVRGRDLSEVLEHVQEGRDGWTLTRALGVLLKACEAMAYAHSKKVIHRDLKPANVMVGRFGEVYVMDWGLAKVLGHEDRRDLRIQDEASASKSIVHTERRDLGAASPLMTMDGDIVGTPSYMSPEQARGELEAMGPASDVYSIGCILYHLLAGHMPYVPEGSKANAYAVWGMLQNGPPTPLREAARGAPEELVAICEKAMARDPAERYADTVQLSEDLHAYLEGRVVRAHATGALVELRKWVRRNKPLAATAAAALGATFGGLGLAYWVKSDAASTLAEQNSEYEVLWRQYSVSRDRIAEMEAQARAERGAAREDREQAAVLRRDVEALRELATEREDELVQKQERIDGVLAEARELSYVAHVTGAAIHLEAGNYTEMFRQLDACPEPLRGWEWKHLSLGENPAIWSASGGSWASLWRDDDVVLQGAIDGFLTVRDGGTGALQTTWKAHELGFAALARAPVPGRFASGGLDGTVVVWDFDAPGLVVAKWKAGEASIKGLAFTPDGGRLVTAEGARHYRHELSGVIAREATEDCCLQVWDAATGELERRIPTDGGPILAVLVHPDGRRAVTASDDGVIRIWDVDTGEQLGELMRRHRRSVHDLALSPDGETLVSAGQDAGVFLWRLEDGEYLGRMEGGHATAVLAVDFAPDGRRLATAGADRSVRVWDVESRQELSVLRGHDGEVAGVAFSPDGKRILSASYDDGLRVWDADTASAVTSLTPNDHRVRELPLEYTDLRGGAPSPTWILELEPGAAPRVPVGEIAALDPSGATLAMPGRKRTLKRTYTIDVWDVERAELLEVLTGHTDAVTDLAWSPDGRWLASASDDRTVRLWDARRGEEGPVLSFEAAVGAVAFSPDGRLLAVGSADGRVQLHDLVNGVVRPLSARHEGGVNELVWSPDGTRLASASADDSILVLWADGSSHRELLGHSGDVTCLAFDAAGRRLFSGARDQTVRVWSATGTWLLTLGGMRSPVTQIAVQRDGRRLITVEGGRHPTVKVWDSDLADARDMWREGERARRAHELVNALFEQHGSLSAVRDALRSSPNVEGDVRAIADVLAGRREE